MFSTPQGYTKFGYGWDNHLLNFDMYLAAIKEANKFKIGDTVKLKSGGIHMTVTKLDGDNLQVVYSDGYKIEYFYAHKDCFQKVV